MLLAALGGGACFGGGSDSTSTATPSAGATDGTATSTATATATVAAEVVFLDARPVEIVEGRAELPSELALVVQRDGELWRIHRTADGAVEERLLFDPFAFSSTRLLTYTAIQTTNPALPVGQLSITACSDGDCPRLGTASEDAVATIFESNDGGVSWVASPEFDGIARVVTGGGATGELVVERLAREGDSRTGRFEWWPSGRVLDPPAGWGGFGEPTVLAGGRVVWWAADGRLIDGEGRALLDLSDELSGGSVALGITVLANGDASRLAVTWQENPPTSQDGPLRWSIYTRAGDQYELDDLVEAIWTAAPVAWLSETTLLTTAEFDWEALGETGSELARPRLPVLFNIAEGTATAVDVPRNTLGEGWAVAAQLGPFAEINAGETDCLNLRTEASLEAGALRCIPHATLLVRLSPLDEEWVNVRTSDGVTGWVSGEFVRGGLGSATATATPEASATATPEASATPEADD